MTMHSHSGWSIPVAGFCPACGGQLDVTSAGVIICRKHGCPDPAAAAKILADTEREHIVVVAEDGGWSCKHPLRERIGDELLGCELWQQMADGRPLPVGRYRVQVSEDGWEWEALP